MSNAAIAESTFSCSSRLHGRFEPMTADFNGCTNVVEESVSPSDASSTSSSNEVTSQTPDTEVHEAQTTACQAAAKTMLACNPIEDESCALPIERLQCTKCMLILRECTKNDASMAPVVLLTYIVDYISKDGTGGFSLCSMPERCGWFVEQLGERLRTGQVWTVLKTYIIAATVAFASDNPYFTHVLYDANIFTKEHAATVWKQLQQTRQYNLHGESLPSPLANGGANAGSGPEVNKNADQTVGEQFGPNTTDAPRLACDVADAQSVWAWCGEMLQKAAELTEATLTYRAAFCDSVTFWPSPKVIIPDTKEDLEIMVDATIALFCTLCAAPSAKAPGKALKAVKEVRRVRTQQMFSLYIVSVNLLACALADVTKKACEAVSATLDALDASSHEEARASAMRAIYASTRASMRHWLRIAVDFNSGIRHAQANMDYVTGKSIRRHVFRLLPDLPIARMVDRVVSFSKNGLTAGNVRYFFEHFFAPGSAGASSQPSTNEESRRTTSEVESVAQTGAQHMGQSLFALQLLLRETSDGVASLFSSRDEIPHALKHANAALDALLTRLSLIGKAPKIGGNAGDDVLSPLASESATPLLANSSQGGLTQSLTHSPSQSGQLSLASRTDSHLAASTDASLTLGTRTFVIRRTAAGTSYHSLKTPAGISGSGDDLPSAAEASSQSDSVETFPSMTNVEETEAYLKMFLEREDVVVVCNEPCSSQDTITLAERFKVLEHFPLGSGSYGSVFRAWDELAGTYLAAKELPIGPKGDAGTQAAREFLKEYTTLTALNHPNIVRVVAFMISGNKGQIFMEWVPSGSLQEVIRNHPHGVLREGVVSRFAHDALCGLHYLHTHNVIHRDVKTANMLLSADGTVKLTDFGTSVVTTVGGRPLQSSAVMGTVAYMDPQSTQGSYSAACDIWAFGCSVVEMITGVTPWTDLYTDARMEAIPLLFRIGGLDETEVRERPHTQLLEVDARLRAGERFNDVEGAARRIRYLSEELKDFLDKIFVLDRTKRPTAAELLTHPFIQIHLAQREERVRAIARAVEEEGVNAADQTSAV